MDSKQHIAKTVNADGELSGALCGEQYAYRLMVNNERAEQLTSCPKCAALWAKQQPEFARIKLERMSGDQECRWAVSTYSVHIDGIHYGYVAIKNKRRGGWMMVGHNKNEIVHDHVSATGRAYERSYFSVKSKELAALRMIEYIGEVVESRESYDKKQSEALTAWRAEMRTDYENSVVRVGQLKRALSAIETIDVDDHADVTADDLIVAMEAIREELKRQENYVAVHAPKFGVENV